MRMELATAALVMFSHETRFIVTSSLAVGTAASTQVAGLSQ